MFRNPVVALDASDYSERAVETALELARRFDATLHGVHVLDVIALEGSLLQDLGGAMGFEPFLNLSAQVQAVLEEKGRELLANFERRCREAGIACTTELLRGIVPNEIVRYAAGKSLILLGRRGENAAFHPDDLGSVAGGVVRRAKVPVWVFTEQRPPLDGIVVGFDGSPRAQRALELALDLATAFAAWVRVVCVEEDPAKGEERLAAARALVGNYGGAIAYERAEGEPAEALRAVAAREGAGLLVVGAFGHNRLLEWLLGSTTEQLLCASTVPILLAR